MIEEIHYSDRKETLQRIDVSPLIYIFKISHARKFRRMPCLPCISIKPIRYEINR